MSDALRFRWLVVRRMPGFPRGGLRLEDLPGGVTLVHGANASGKTTAARALQAALWSTAAPDSAGVDAAFELEGAAWLVELDAPRVRWQRDTVEAGAPALPPADTRDRYFLSLHGLLSADQEDRDLADRIRVESAGGYDVAGAAAALKIESAGAPRSLQQNLRSAEARLREAQAKESELRAAVTELARLRSAHGVARERGGAAEALRRALEVARAAEALASAELRLAAFPDGMDRLDGQEPSRLDACDAAIEQAERELAAAREKAAAAVEELERVGLGEAGLPAQRLDELDEHVQQARDAEREIVRDREALAEAAAERELAGARLGIEREADPLPDPAAAEADALQRLIERAQRLEERRSALEERLRVLGAPSESPEADRLTDLEDAASALREWLRTGEGGGTAETRLRMLVLVAAGALALAGGAALLVGVPLLGAAALVAAALVLVLRPRPSSADRTPLERRATQAGEAPTAWTADAVESALRGLDRRLAAVRAEVKSGELRAQEAARLEAMRPQLEEDAAALRSERERVATALGLAPATDDLALHVTATRLREWSAARRAEVARAADLAGHAAALSAALAAGADLAADHCAEDDVGRARESVAALAALARDLRGRRERHAAAVAAREAALRDRERAEQDRASGLSERAGVFDAAGLPPEREHELRSRAELVEDYREARRAADEAGTRRSLLERSLDDIAPEGSTARAAVEAASPGGIPGLEQALAGAEEAMAGATSLARSITQIETRLAEARRKHDVEEALAGVDAAMAALRDQRAADVEAEVGVALVEWLGARAADHGRPAVFERARDLLETITRHRYVLDLGHDGSFRARDTVTGRGHALDELSSGTRLQLLLAVRVAFVETQEAGAALPLLLDEVLANSDEQRADAIIEAAIGLARRGRQIFYFTAQADELARWRRALDAAPDVDWGVRSLDGGGDGAGPERGQLRGPIAAEIEWSADPVEAVPSPDGLDYDAYGRALAVPRLDPWSDGLGGVHLWYLLDEPDALHGLLKRGITRWGQLERVGRVTAAPDAALRAALERAASAAALCERFLQLWRSGRGQAVDRAALADAPAVSDTMFDRVCDLCERVDGDARALIAALEDRQVERFHAAKTEELRDWLRENGYMAEAEPLSAAELRLALSADAARVAPSLDPADIDALLDRFARGPAILASGHGRP